MAFAGTRSLNSTSVVSACLVKGGITVLDQGCQHQAGPLGSGREHVYQDAFSPLKTTGNITLDIPGIDTLTPQPEPCILVAYMADGAVVAVLCEVTRLIKSRAAPFR